MWLGKGQPSHAFDVVLGEAVICTHCGAEYESGKGGAKGLCPKDYKRVSRGQSLDAPDRAARGHGTEMNLKLSIEQKSAWERAAKKAKQAFREWIRATLDAASKT